MRFQVALAVRHLRSGGWQTALIVGGVAVAVTLVIFVSGLITGLQQSLVNTITGSIAHVTVQAPEREPRVPGQIPGAGEGTVVLAKSEQRTWQPDTIDQCRCLERELGGLAHVTAVSPGVGGTALITAGGSEASVRVLGALPLQQNQISSVTEDLVAGSYLDLGADQIVVGYTLAKKFGLELGDRVRLATGAGYTETFRVAGIVYQGQESVDGSAVYVNLRAAQTLFRKGTLVTTLGLKVDDVFLANAVGDAIESSFDLKVDTWMRQNPRLLSGLRAQSGSSLMISAFSLVASGFAIASVLIVSVVRRSREIGILKAIGARRRQILTVFTIEGLVIGVLGSVVGAALGSGVILLLSSIKQPVRVPGQVPDPLFPGIVTAEVVLGTMLAGIVIAVVASVLPARQAANLDPVEVIQRG
jgi:lipoprotein-releasing system permease protein